MIASRLSLASLREAFFLAVVLLGSWKTSSAQVPSTISIQGMSLPLEGGTTVFERVLTFEPSDPQRTIQVSPGLKYILVCRRSGGISSSGVWYKDNVLVTTNSSKRVYATNPDSNHWQLIFSNFSQMDVGIYSCRTTVDSHTVTMQSSNPAVIPVTPSLTFTAGPVNSPSINAFITGNPLPTEGRWLFNGGTTLPDGTGSFTMGVLIFGAVIGVEHSGTYTYEVTNSAGTASADFTIIVIVDPALSITPDMNTPLYLAAGENYTLHCYDIVGRPPPTIQWTLDDRVLTEGDGVSIMSYSNSTFSSSTLQLTSLDVERGGRYQCVGNNRPGDTSGDSAQRLTIVVLAPPPPPSDIIAIPISLCSVNVTWDFGTLNSTTVVPMTYIIEYQLAGEEWVELGRNSSLFISAEIPSRGVSTRYNLRGRGYNATFGFGSFSGTYGPFMIYQDTMLPDLMDVSGQPETPTSIRVSWIIPSDDCYSFTNFAISCERVGQNDSTSITTSTSRSAFVNDLIPNSAYSCEVAGTFTDNGGRIVMDRVSEPFRTFTFPNAPPPPADPKLDADSVTTKSFTVSFEPLPASQNISHYQILVLRLGSGQSVPSDHPDILYTSSNNLPGCVDVNLADNENGPFMPYVAIEFSASDFQRDFVVGGGAVLNRGDYDCNEELASGSKYTTFLRAFPDSLMSLDEFAERGDMRRRRQVGVDEEVRSRRQYTVFSSSDFLPAVDIEVFMPPTTAPVTPEGNGGNANIMIIVITVVIVAFILTIALIVVVGGVWYMRHTRKRSVTFNPSVDHSLSDSSSDLGAYMDTPDLGRKKNGNMVELKEMEAFSDPLDVPFEPSGAVRREDFAAHVEKFDAKRQLLFQEEFEFINKLSPWHPAEASTDPRNDSKNRYSNITAFDHSSVKLKLIPGVECSDYINANYINGFKRPCEYIAAQGPLDQTVEDFWRMIWEQNTTTIIMLTNVVELGKIKCSQYWPNSSKTMYGDIAVTLEDTHTFPNYTIRTLNVQSAKTNEARRVLQFHYTKWPDYGTPNLAAPLLNFLKIVHESNDSEENAGPVVVHCSAGVGRSGTVLTIDYCLQQLKQEDQVNICGFVRSMREQRNYMVQTDQQYTFIHYAILEAITYGDTSFDLQGFMESYSRLQSGSPAHSPGKSLLGEEFDRLGVVKTMVKKSSFQKRLRVKGAPQRHFHSSFHGGSTSGSIQQCLGHFLDGYNQCGAFLVMEGPDEMSAPRFWEMIWDHNCACIIMLTPQDAEEFFCYWPDSGETEAYFGSVRVMVESESAEHFYTIRKITLTNTKVDGISHQVIQYQFMGWTTQYLPGVPDFVAFVCDVLTKVDMASQNNRIMVHDTSSLGPAGIFCSLLYIIQRIGVEKMIDIFQAVQMIQLQRPGCVAEVEEYAFIYDCVYEFLMKNS